MKNKLDILNSPELNDTSNEEFQSLVSRSEAILAAVPDIIMEINERIVYTWANKAGREFFGEDVIGKEVSHYFEGEQNTYDKIQPIFSGDEKVIYNESWQRRRDGAKRLLACWCRVLKDSRGNTKGAIVAARDITENARIVEQIRFQNQLYNSTIEAIPHPFYVVDAADYRILMGNSATALYGSISNNATCYALTHNREEPCRGTDNECPLEIVKKTKKPVILEHVHYDKDGKARYVEVHGYPVLDDEGNVAQMIEYEMNITERKQVEEILREDETRFRSVLQSAHDAIVSIDSQGKIIFWNNKAEAMFGYPESEAAGKSVSMIMPERFREGHENGIRRAIATGKSKIIGRTVELQGLKKDGNEFPLELSLACWETREGTFFTGIMRDISERKKAEEQLTRANERMMSDLEAAARVQKSLLPQECINMHGIQCASAFEPCDDLGGDIYNIFPLDEKHLGLYILDVSGHGVTAALLSVTLSHLMFPPSGQSSILKQHTGHSPGYRLVPPVEVVRQLNRQFPMDSDKLQYFTLVYGILNVETNELRFVVAGHPRPIYIAGDSKAVPVGKPGVPVGTLEDADYVEQVLVLKPGDRLYLYSDGITETTNSKDELFDRDRLIDTLDRNRSLSLADSISSLLKDVAAWRDYNRTEDDISILALQCRDNAAGEP